MTRNRVALVVSDVDGTLVTSSKELTARSRAAVASLDRHGIAFTIISSRPPFGLRMLIDPLNLRLPIAAFNGGALAMPDLTILERRSIGREAAGKALACFDVCEVDVWLFTHDRWLSRHPKGAYVDLERRTVKTEPVVVESFTEYLEHAIKLVGVSADAARLTECGARAKAALAGEATVARSQSYYLDITPAGVDKGTAIRELMRHCGVDPADVVSIGDMDNDVPMFRSTGFSIAMSNGSAAARAAASAIAGSNDADGFADAVERLILPRAAAG